MPVAALTIFLPEGVKAESTQLADHGLQPVNNLQFQMYAAGNIAADATIKFTLSATPQTASSSTTETTPNNNLLIGAGALGIALILVGAWIYFRDRNRGNAVDDDDQADFESSEDVMDAIIALDDLHVAKKISDEAYQRRRNELKEILKGMM